MIAEAIETRATLKKEIGRVGFFCLAFGAMIGVGWVTAMGSWLQAAGPLGAALAFIAGGVVMLFIGFCYAEVTAMLPVSGGEVAYAYKAFGVGHSFLVGWFLTFGYLSVSAFEAISIGRIISYLLPQTDRWPLYSIQGETIFGTHLVIAVVFVALITTINYVGVQSSMRFQVYLTIAFLIIVTIVAFTGLLFGEASHLKPLFNGETTSARLAGMLGVFATVPFWLVGFDTIPQGAEEAKESVSYRTIGLLILVSIVAASCFYALLILSAGSVVSRSEVADTTLYTAEAFAIAFQSSLFSKVILVAIVIGLLTSWNGFFLAGSRVLFALGRGRIVGTSLGGTHPKFKTPYNSVLFCGAITLVCTLLGRGAMIAFVDVGSFCIATAFLGVSFSFLKLRRSFPNQPRPYRAPGGKWSGYLAVGGSTIILLAITLPGSPAALRWPLEWAILVVACLLGWLVWTTSKKSRTGTSTKQRDYFILEQFA
jgi:amino acid transporter